MLNIGPIQLDVPFVQAALSGYSDLPMRLLARRFGAPYALNEVMLDRLVVEPGKRRKAILDVHADDHPVGGQLMGADPEVFAPAAAAMADAGYDVIDINFGCPVKKVLGRCRGGFLLSQPADALDIIRRVHEAVGKTHPVTVKMRRGMDDSPESERNFFTILDGAFEIGVAAVTVHGRTVKQRYVGPSRWAFLAQVKRHVGDAVILGSGDLFSAEACVRMIHETGVDGVTIARGAIGNPWIFEECRALWSGQPLPPPPTIERQRSAIAMHFEEIVGVYGESLGTRIMRKFGLKYAEHHPLARPTADPESSANQPAAPAGKPATPAIKPATPVRDAFLAVKTAADLHAVLDEWYDPSRNWPPVPRRTDHGDLVAAGATE